MPESKESNDVFSLIFAIVLSLAFSIVLLLAAFDLVIWAATAQKIWTYAGILMFIGVAVIPVLELKNKLHIKNHSS